MAQRLHEEEEPAEDWGGAIEIKTTDSFFGEKSDIFLPLFHFGACQKNLLRTRRKTKKNVEEATDDHFEIDDGSEQGTTGRFDEI